VRLLQLHTSRYHALLSPMHRTTECQPLHTPNHPLSLFLSDPSERGQL
jgi:hypothetical protein